MAWFLQGLPSAESRKRTKKYGAAFVQIVASQCFYAVVPEKWLHVLQLISVDNEIPDVGHTSVQLNVLSSGKKPPRVGVDFH